jgi:hypothetical protein
MSECSELTLVVVLGGSGFVVVLGGSGFDVVGFAVGPGGSPLSTQCPPIHVMMYVWRGTRACSFAAGAW